MNLLCLDSALRSKYRGVKTKWYIRRSISRLQNAPWNQLKTPAPGTAPLTACVASTMSVWLSSYHRTGRSNSSQTIWGRLHTGTILLSKQSAAAKLRAAGLTPIAGDFANPASLAAPAAQVDAVVSTASIGQVEGTPESFAKDRDAVEVMTKALGDSGKPLIFTSGSAIFGVCNNGAARPTIFDEEHPVPLPASVFAPPEAEIPPPFIAAFGGAMAPRAETETAVLRSTGIRGIAIRPDLVYGEGRGYDLPNLIALTKTHGAAPHLG